MIKVSVCVQHRHKPKMKRLDLPMDHKDLKEAMSPFGEEYEIVDHDSNLYIPEFSDLYKLNWNLNKIAQFDLSDEQFKALSARIVNIHNMVQALEKDSVHFIHLKPGDGYKELAEYLVYEKNYMQVPDRLKPYIDYEVVGWDLEVDWYIHSNGVAVLTDMS